MNFHWKDVEELIFRIDSQNFQENLQKLQKYQLVNSEDFEEIINLAILAIPQRPFQIKNILLLITYFAENYQILFLERLSPLTLFIAYQTNLITIELVTQYLHNLAIQQNQENDQRIKDIITIFQGVLDNTDPLISVHLQKIDFKPSKDQLQFYMRTFSPKPICEIIKRDDIDSLVKAISPKMTAIQFFSQKIESNPFELIPLLRNSPTLLHYAVCCGAEKCVDYILSTGISTNLLDGDNCSVSEMAVFSGNVHIFKQFVFDSDPFSCALAAASAHRQVFLSYYLSLLSENSNPKIISKPIIKPDPDSKIEILKEEENDDIIVFTKSKDMETIKNLDFQQIVIRVIESDSFQGISELMKNNIDIFNTNKFRSVFTTSIENGFFVLANVLCTLKGAKLISNIDDYILFNVLQHQHFNTFKALSQLPGADLNKTEELLPQSTVLHKAIHLGLMDFVKYICETPSIHADINHFNGIGETPVLYAAAQAKWDILNYLLSLPNIDTTTPSEFGVTIIHNVARHGNTPLLKKLLDTGKFDVNSQTYSGLTPLIVAVTRNQYDVVDYLIHRKDIQLNIKDDNGETALSMASSLRAWECVAILMKVDGLDMTSFGRSDAAPLATAIESKQWNIVKVMLEKSGKNGNSKLDVDQVGRWTETPIALATKFGQFDVVKKLVQMGADVNADTPFSPLAYAQGYSSEKRPEIERFLKKQGAKFFTCDDGDDSSSKGSITII